MKSTNRDLLYAIALSMVEGIGPVLARKLIQKIGSPELVFKEKEQSILAIEGMGPERVYRLRNSSVLHAAEKEVQLLTKNNWIAHYYRDSTYPRRLRHTNDAPLVLFQKGVADLNPKRTVSIIGSRKMTEAGGAFVKSLTIALKPFQTQVISGLAYGIDSMAHRSALDHDINNIAVVAHGLDHLYPSLNRGLAQNIIESGGAILTEFISGTVPDRENFPKRNRIIAGLSDAVIVVEAAKKGGALITAQLANEYNRDVFAVPGTPGQKSNEGCNLLIKSHRANLLESVQDIRYVMRWEEVTEESLPRNFESFAIEDRNLLEWLAENNTVKDLDWLCQRSGWLAPEILSRLVMLELEGMVQVLPGNRYSLLS